MLTILCFTSGLQCHLTSTSSCGCDLPVVSWWRDGFRSRSGAAWKLWVCSCGACRSDGCSAIVAMQLTKQDAVD